MVLLLWWVYGCWRHDMMKPEYERLNRILNGDCDEEVDAGDNLFQSLTVFEYE